MEYKSFDEYLKTLPPKTVFRLWERKQIFTPYEWDKKFSDQSTYENDECLHVCISDTIELPDGDLLLITYEPELEYYLSYYKLSEISLAKSDKDMEAEE